MSISIRFKNNGTLHEDIILDFDGDISLSDSYFFAMEPTWYADKEVGEEKAILVFIKLITYFQNLILELAQGQTIWLPYDLSDQCSSWLKCRMDSDNLVLVRGWNEIGCLFPSVAVSHVKNVPSFNPIGAELYVKRSDFQDSLSESIAIARKLLSVFE